MSQYWEPHPTDIVVIGGRPLRDVKVALPPETFERLATGYACMRCLEPLQEAYPETCPNAWCAYEIRREQKADFERSLEHIEPYVPPDELPPVERARKAGIVVPGSIA